MSLISREFRQTVTPMFRGEVPAFATTLLAALIKMNGVQCLEWDPLTIELELKDDLGVEMPRRVYDQLMALITALATDRVYKDVPLFDETVSALAGRGLGVEKDVPPVLDVAWAVTEIRMNDPDPVSRDPQNPWSRDIQRYVRVVLDDEGLEIPPKALDFAAGRPAAEAEGNRDPQLFAGAWASSQARSDEIDLQVEELATKLVGQLMALGLDFEQKQAEWTSERNRDVHLEKHGPEFGTDEDYLRAEEEYARRQPVTTERSCRTDAQGTTRCADRQEFDDQTVRVVNDQGQTITLYRRAMHGHLADLARQRLTESS